MRVGVRGKRKRTRGAFFLGFATCIFLLMSLGSSAEGFAPRRRCVKRQHVLLERGHDRAGEKWTVSASIRNNPGCMTWFLQVEVAPSATRRGSWRWGVSIAPGGSLPKTFSMDASDETARVGRAFSGITRDATRKVVVQFANGKKIVLHPKRPAQAVRRRRMWLKDLRYFIRFDPAEYRARVARGYDQQGHELFELHGFEGAFEGDDRRSRIQTQLQG